MVMITMNTISYKHVRDLYRYRYRDSTFLTLATSIGGAGSVCGIVGQIAVRHVDVGVGGG